jgi:hypothetical protein
MKLVQMDYHAIFSVIICSFRSRKRKNFCSVVSDSTDSHTGANVLVKGTKKECATHLDGKYAVKANVGDVLLFSYRYKGVESKVGLRNVINVT